MKKNIILSVLGFAVLLLIYFSGQQSGIVQGKAAATKEYNEIIAAYSKALAAQTQLVNDVLGSAAKDLTKEVNILLQDTQEIRKQLKNQPQPLVVVNEGKCLASDVQLEARRKMIERINK